MSLLAQLDADLQNMLVYHSRRGVGIQLREVKLQLEGVTWRLVHHSIITEARHQLRIRQIAVNRPLRRVQPAQVLLLTAGEGDGDEGAVAACRHGAVLTHNGAANLVVGLEIGEDEDGVEGVTGHRQGVKDGGPDCAPQRLIVSARTR